jgi:hypothetical protein
MKLSAISGQLSASAEQSVVAKWDRVPPVRSGERSQDGPFGAIRTRLIPASMGARGEGVPIRERKGNCRATSSHIAVFEPIADG